MLALQAYRDAETEGISGMVAVALVIRYRVRAGFYGGDWLQVLSHHQDYAAVHNPHTPDLPDPRHPSFSQLLQQIDGIFDGRREDDILVPNATMGPIVSFDGQPERPVPLYYARLDDPNIGQWFLENISRNTDKHRLIATVGNLSFFS